MNGSFFTSSNAVRRVLPLLLLVLACGRELTADESAVRIRIQNAGALDFTRTLVVYPEQQVQYGLVRAGTSTEYRELSKAYRYAYIEVEAGGRRYVLQPIDYVGERLLGSGSYTYRVTVDPETGHMALQFLID
jgi:hypothetical protein